MAYCLRFLRKTRRQTQFPEQLTPDEISKAYNKVLFLIQGEEINDEIRQLKGGEELQRMSKQRKLKPIIDKTLLKVGGRIKKSMNILWQSKSYPSSEKTFRNRLNYLQYSLKKCIWVSMAPYTI